MDKINVEQTDVMAQSEKEQTGSRPIETGANSTEVSYGKFKDANALLTAYNNLEAEFTKRCQKVKELETKLTAVDKEITPTETEDKKEILSSEEKDDILKSYLKDLLSKKQRAIVLDGVGIGAKAPSERPKTFEQAGQLAKELLIKHL